jgi:hypothetical protein
MEDVLGEEQKRPANRASDQTGLPPAPSDEPEHDHGGDHWASSEVSIIPEDVG